MKVYDLAQVCRSKNAGPFQLTIDLMFAAADDYARLIGSPRFTTGAIAHAYGIDPAEVQIKPFARILTVKVVLPREVSSGAPGDRDVYGSQQHFPLGDLEI